MNLLLYLIALLEGFTTLSVEIMSIRNSIAIIGSNAVATSIILWVILLALSYGYYRGWVYASIHTSWEIKRKIAYNLLLASVFYTFLAFPLENTFLTYLLREDLGYFISILISMVALFFLPVFLASQTIPLLSRVVEGDEKSLIVGKLLFFSTIGSFLGSVVTSLVFFPYFWVEKSIIINGVILSMLVYLLYPFLDRKILSKWMMGIHAIYTALLITLLCLDIRSLLTKPGELYAYSSPYNDIVISEEWGTRYFRMNGSHSSGIDIDTNKSNFAYNREFIRLVEQEKPKRILVIGAAGFSMPQEVASYDFVEHIDVSDIDGSLEKIATEYFLKVPLHEKIRFLPVGAREFLMDTLRRWERYDMVIVDAYTGMISIPSELLTYEFFSLLKQASNGTIAFNIIIDRAKWSQFTRNLEASLVAALGDMHSRPMYPERQSYFDNYIFVNRDYPAYAKIQASPWSIVSTDDRHTLEIDKYRLFYKYGYN